MKVNLGIVILCDAKEGNPCLGLRQKEKKNIKKDNLMMDFKSVCFGCF